MLSSQDRDKLAAHTSLSKWSEPGRSSVEQFLNTRDEETGKFKNRTNPELLAYPANENRQYLRCRMGSADEIKAEFETILNMNFRVLQECLQQDTYNAYTVLSAYVWRALEINKEINCITQFIGNAFDKAIALDQSPKQTLHGLPFSVKSSMAVAGYPITVGLGKRVGMIETETCPIVQFLENQGAIPFCLTNVPQGLLSYVTSNPLHGATRNPWDYERTPGGSSGGEAALLAAGGAVFGVGSDLGGSLRIPAAFCGLTTLKPTQDRLYTTHMHGGVPGRGRLGLSSGFITRTVAEQELLLGLIIGSPAYRALCPKSSPSPMIPLPNPDPLLGVNGHPPLPADHTFRSSLRIGVFLDDAFQTAVPSSQNAVKKTVALLMDRRDSIRRYHFVEFDMTKIRGYCGNRMAEMFFKNAMPDNGLYMSEMYENEPRDKCMSTFIRLINWKRNIFVRLFSSVGSRFIDWYSHLFAVLGRAHNSSPVSVRENQEKTDEFQENFIKYMKEERIDALICPAFITPAQYLEYPAQLTTGTYLTGLFNMLDFPAGIVPVGHVSNDDTRELQSPSYFMTNSSDRLIRKQRATSLNTEGLPTAVQVVTLPNEEETCLRVMKLIEKHTENYVQHLKWQETDDAATDARDGVSKSKKHFKRVPSDVEAPTGDYLEEMRLEKHRIANEQRDLNREV